MVGKTDQERLAYIRSWQDANPEKVTSNKRRYAKSEKGIESRRRNQQRTKEREASDPEYRAKRQEGRRLAAEKNRDRNRDKRRMDKYGITGDEYRALLFQQDGKCWICGTRPDEGKDLAVDHDHATGTVRGLLCVPCNLGLGSFRDDIPRLLMAAKYLEVHNAG